ncbi:MAG TPA: hypothetical protein VGO28_04070 [Acidimicrobiia bacterium]|jgi:hypothetical protein
MTGGKARAARLRELRERTRLEPGSSKEAECAAVYESFGPLNREVLRVCTDWQVRPGGAPNDHGDATYDWSVVDRLTALDERAGPLLRRLGASIPQFAPYHERLRSARRRVVDGEREWFTSPRVDSYHTVWMELHEDLLAALGRERER